MVIKPDLLKEMKLGFLATATMTCLETPNFAVSAGIGTPESQFVKVSCIFAKWLTAASDSLNLRMQTYLQLSIVNVHDLSARQKIADVNENLRFIFVQNMEPVSIWFRMKHNKCSFKSTKPTTRLAVTNVRSIVKVMVQFPLSLLHK